MRYIFVEADLSQAEDRVVKMLTGNEDLIELARKLPWEFDVHTFNAARIFGVPEAQVTKEQRYLAKRTVHAGNYGMGAERLSEVLLVDGYPTSIDACQQLMNSYFTGPNTSILAWQREVRKAVMRDGKLRNSWGREFLFPKLNEEAYRGAYASVPSSEVADLLNQWGLIPTHSWLRRNKMRSFLNAQVHDSILLSCPIAEVLDVMDFIRSSLELPRLYAGNELTIPVSFKIGANWGANMYEFKKFLTSKAVMQRVDAIQS